LDRCIVNREPKLLLDVISEINKRLLFPLERACGIESKPRKYESKKNRNRSKEPTYPLDVVVDSSLLFIDVFSEIVQITHLTHPEQADLGHLKAATFDRQKLWSVSGPETITLPAFSLCRPLGSAHFPRSDLDRPARIPKLGGLRL
jgi:hypothetical protein